MYLKSEYFLPSLNVFTVEEPNRLEKLITTTFVRVNGNDGNYFPLWGLKGPTFTRSGKTEVLVPEEV